MDKFLSFLKRHRKKLIVLVIMLIIIGGCVYAGYRLISYLNPNSKKSVYGDRCELTESILITKERKNIVKEAINKHEKMELSTIDIKCNLIDIIVNVDASVETKTVKEMSNDIIAAFTAEELKYYDLELWINWTGEGSEDKIPMIGTKHKMINGESNKSFVW